MRLLKSHGPRIASLTGNTHDWRVNRCLNVLADRPLISPAD